MYKKLKIIIIAILFVPLTLIAQQKPTIQFSKVRHDFGTIEKKKQKEVTVKFEFTNTDSIPLIITKVDVSCGCLSAEYTQKPIQKGEQGEVKVIIDTENQERVFSKSVFVRSNAKNDIVLLRVIGYIE